MLQNGKILTPYLKVHLGDAVESGVPDRVVPVADLLGDLLEARADRRLQHVRAVVLHHEAQVVQALCRVAIQ